MSATLSELDLLRKHVADGGRLTHDNGLYLLKQIDRLDGLLNRPEVSDFLKGVPLEAAHQVERWGVQHDQGKAPLDWFWLIGYLAQKAATAAIGGDLTKAKHHTISTAAALANWHAQLSGGGNLMRPGIDPAEIEGAS